MKGRHLIALSDFSREEITRILDRSAELKAAHRKGEDEKSLAGKSVAMIFEKPSTRTRVSFEVGIAQLGGTALYLTKNDLQLSRGEPVKDIARVLSRYVDAVVIRANRHEDVAELAGYSTVPVINGLTDLVHPCQILADLLTMREYGMDLDRAKVAFIGDGNNVAHSWINAAAIFKFDLMVACPEDYGPDRSIVEAAEKAGARVSVVHEPERAAEGADVLYTDVWVSMGQEEEKEKRLRDFSRFQINRELLELAAGDAKVMHCLPAHRGKEITDEVIEGEHSIVFDQAENRLHVQKAVLDLFAGG